MQSSGTRKHYDRVNGSNGVAGGDAVKSVKGVYVIHLNPSADCGMTHQLWGIVDGLMIANYTGRDLHVLGFCPDLDNNKVCIPLSKIMDIEATNQALSRPVLRFQARLVDKLPPNVSVSECPLSKYACPLMNRLWVDLHPSERMAGMIKALRQEDKDRLSSSTSTSTSGSTSTRVFDRPDIVNLGSTFIWPMLHYFDPVYAPFLYRQAVRVAQSLIPTAAIKNLVSLRLAKMPIKEPFAVVHLRLEDDWVIHRVQNYRLSPHIGVPPHVYSQNTFAKYLAAIDRIPKTVHLYVATGLGRFKNTNDPLLQKLVEHCTTSSGHNLNGGNGGNDGRSRCVVVSLATADTRDKEATNLPPPAAAYHWGPFEHGQQGEAATRISPGRDLSGYVDYTVAAEGATYFIGSANSSFSHGVANVFAGRDLSSNVCLVDD